jgi:hypothetical protein
VSFDGMQWAWRQHVRPSGRKLVLVALAFHADDHGYCWVGDTVLARETGLDERNVRRHNAELVASKHVRRVMREHRRRDGTLGVWLLQLACANPREPMPERWNHRTQASGGPQDKSGRDHRARASAQELKEGTETLEGHRTSAPCGRSDNELRANDLYGVVDNDGNLIGKIGENGFVRDDDHADPS